MSDQKTVAILGFGGHAQASWLKAIKNHPDFNLIGIIDKDTEKLSHVPEMGTGLTEDQVFTSIEDIVQGYQKPDLVVVATPIYTHHALVKHVMDFGINVICEKNMASTIYQGRQMVQLAIDHPELTTAMGTQRRFSPTYWTAKKFLQEENQIGNLHMIRWCDAFSWGEYRAGWREFLPELFAEDQMIHWFDLMRNITQMDIVQVNANSYLPNWSTWQGASSIIAHLALAKKEDYNHRHNWVWAQFYGDWQRGGKSDSTVEFSGEKGRFILDSRWGLKLELYQDPAGTKYEEDGYMPQKDIEHMGVPYEGQQIILEQVKRSIDSGGKDQPQNNFKDVFKSFAATMGAIESSRTGKSIWVPDYWKDMNIE